MADRQPTDILARLHAPMWSVEPVDIRAVAKAAADEIERLRGAIETAWDNLRDYDQRHDRDDFSGLQHAIKTLEGAMPDD